MIFKGDDFKLVKNIVSLPTHDKEKNLHPYLKAEANYVVFGVVTKKENKAGAFPSEYSRVNHETDERSIIFAVPLAITGYSLTNMAYGQDGYKYLHLNGKFYRSKNKLKKFTNK